MFNRLIGGINYNGYDITVRYNNVNGMYQLTTMAQSMGEEYREAMLSDTNPMEDKSIIEKFIARIEHNK